MKLKKFGGIRYFRESCLFMESTRFSWLFFYSYIFVIGCLN